MFFGNIDSDEVKNKLNVIDKVSVSPRIPYDEALGYMLNSQVLLLFGNKNSKQIPAKVYDYFGAEGLIFVILGDENEDSQSKIMIFSDMGIFKLLCQLSDEKEMMEYVPESLQKLYHYKKQQRQDLILTLKTYLEHNQNLTKTAQDLYIHYKTAAYRIERISQITGIDFDNPNEVLSVRIGLVVCKMMENLKK